LQSTNGVALGSQCEGLDVAMPRTDQRTWMLPRAEEDPGLHGALVAVEASGPLGDKP
jgi:hypothetical protein